MCISFEDGSHSGALAGGCCSMLSFTFHIVFIWSLHGVFMVFLHDIRSTASLPFPRMHPSQNCLFLLVCDRCFWGQDAPQNLSELTAVLQRVHDTEQFFKVVAVLCFIFSFLIF